MKDYRRFELWIVAIMVGFILLLLSMAWTQQSVGGTDLLPTTHETSELAPPTERASRDGLRETLRAPSPSPQVTVSEEVEVRSLGVLQITAYCWTGNHNASGTWPELGEVATLDRSIPFGTRLRIEGVGDFVVADRIGHSSDVDIYMGREGCLPKARKFGRQHREVWIIEETS